MPRFIFERNPPLRRPSAAGAPLHTQGRRLRTPAPPAGDPHRQPGRRLALLLGLLGALFCLALGRAWQLQVQRHAQLSALALQQNQRTLQTQGQRGAVHDRNGQLLALSIQSQSFYVHPPQLRQPQALAEALAPLLGLPAAALLERLTADRPFVWLKRQASPAEAEALLALNVEQLHSIPEQRRVHPGGTLAGALLGFTGVDHQGLAGLEYAYDSHLRGQVQRRVVHKDALGRLVLSGEERALAAGGQVRLALHAGIQHHAERALVQAVEESEARFAVAVVLHAPSAEVLALAQHPPFDPNQPLAGGPAYVNHALTSGFEPGSTMKPFTLAAALETRHVGVEQMAYCEQGEWRIHDAVIHDTAPHGWLSLEDVLRVSSNICAAKVGLRMPPQVFYTQLRRLGFGRRLGIYQDAQGRQLGGEAEGRLLVPRNWTPVDHIAMSFGHGLLVSPLQMAVAMNTLANGGIWRPPRLVLALQPARPRLSRATRRIYSPQTATALRSFLQAASTRKGTGWRAQPAGYIAAGKTGTTEVYDIQARGYSKTRHIASFVGFAPIHNPALTVFVLVAEPRHQRIRFGGQAPAKAFRRIMETSLPLLGVWPTRQP